MQDPMLLKQDPTPPLAQRDSLAPFAISDNEP